MSSSSSALLATHANCLPVGTVISDFEIIGLVGEGGFGIVYLARDTSLDRVVAVKEFMPAAFAGRVDGVRVAVRAANHQATFEAGLQSFIKEAKMLAKFAHPALVEVYRFWEGNGTAYMAMRFYAGETLRQKLSKGETQFTEETIAQIMSPIFDALDMLHREQVFHRDIAPDNIMLADDRPVLLDFGSARRIIGDGTQALTTVLKPGYAPIEQYVDDGTMKQGAWTDVYALGGVLYHLATGKAPLQAVSRLISDPLQSVNEVTGGVFSATFSNAVAMAMAVRVENRLQSVKDFREMLGWSVVQPARVVTLPVTPVTPTPQAVAPAPVTAAAVPLSDMRAESAPAVVPLPMSAAGDEPAYPPGQQRAGRRSSLWVGVGVGGLVLVSAAFLMFRPASQPVVSPPSPVPASPVVVAPPSPVPIGTSVPNPPAAVVTEAPAVVPVVRTGVVKLNISPWGTVVVDGVTRGISNASQLRQLELPVGTHTIEIAKPDAKPVVQTIEVSAEFPVSISHSFK